MKKVVLFVFLAAMLTATSAVAQTANGTLTVTATVNSSINLVFNSDGSGVALSTGAGTSTATLPFGAVSAFGALSSPNITRTVVAGTSFTVSTPVDVLVTKANSASANYKLTAQLGATDAATWQVGGIGINSASPTTITSTGAYGSNVAEAVALTFLFTTPSGTSINNTIGFTATAN